QYDFSDDHPEVLSNTG
ncbi:hypothetical protein CFC21_091706, partial [Triticum aestivum]